MGFKALASFIVALVVFPATYAQLWRGLNWNAGRLNWNNNAVIANMANVANNAANIGIMANTGSRANVGNMANIRNMANVDNMANIGNSQFQSQSATIEEMTMTCVGTQIVTGGDNVIAVTIKQAPQTINNNIWGFGKSIQLQAQVIIHSKDIDGVFSLVLTQRSRDESYCSPDGLGDIVQRPKYGGVFGIGRFAGNKNQDSTGILREVDITPDEIQDLDISGIILPYTNLKDFAGRGFALCGMVLPIGDVFVTNNFFGFPHGQAQQVHEYICDGPIPLCCKLGYDVTDAMP